MSKLCNSCGHFLRIGNATDRYGICTIDLPPWLTPLIVVGENLATDIDRTVRDDASCDLWEAHDGQG